MPARANVQYSNINLSSTGAGLLTIVNTAGGPGAQFPSNKFMSIWEIGIVVNTASSLQFQDNQGNLLSGQMPMLANGSIYRQAANNLPMFQVNPGNNFCLNSSVAVQVGGWVIYSE